MWGSLHCAREACVSLCREAGAKGLPAAHCEGVESEMRRLLAGRAGDSLWGGLDDSVGCGRELLDATLVIWTSLLQADDEFVDGAEEGDLEAMASGCSGMARLALVQLVFLVKTSDSYNRYMAGGVPICK